MLLEILLALLIGLLFGTITGLTPGIHINLVGAALVSLSASLLSPIEPIYLVIFIVSMSITHTFIDFIPSIFLGAPDTDTELSVLPGHEMLKEGEGYHAVMLSAYGGLAAVSILIIIFLPFIWFIPKMQSLIKEIIPFILIAISLFLILSEKNKIKALFAFLIAGILGVLILNLESIKISEPLLPLLTGLFGASSIIISIKNKTKIPPQKISDIKPSFSRPMLGAAIASPICGFLPGLGSGQVAILGNTISRCDKKGFLVLLGATNTLMMGFSFISLYAISKTRSGSAAAIEEILGKLNINILLIIIGACFISGILAFFLTKSIAKFFSQKINSINYTLLSKTTLIIILVVVLLVSGAKGILILAVSTLAGIYILTLNVRRTNMMGVLLLPTILYYFI